MSGQTPDSADAPDLYAIAAFTAFYSFDGTEAALGEWRATTERERERWRACADAVIMLKAVREPDDGRHPDGCTCQFCREDARLDREELDDDTDNTIPDTEGGDW